MDSLDDVNKAIKDLRPILETPTNETERAMRIGRTLNGLQEIKQRLTKALEVGGE